MNNNTFKRLVKTIIKEVLIAEARTDIVPDINLLKKRYLTPKEVTAEFRTLTSPKFQKANIRIKNFIEIQGGLVLAILTNGEKVYIKPKSLEVVGGVPEKRNNNAIKSNDLPLPKNNGYKGPETDFNIKDRAPNIVNENRIRSIVRDELRKKLS